MTFHSIPHRIIYTLATYICGGPIQVNRVVNDKKRDFVIPGILLVMDVVLDFENADGTDTFEIDEHEDSLGRRWMGMSIDGGLLMERNPQVIRKVVDVLTARASEFDDDEEIGDFEWGEEEEEMPSLRTEDLLFIRSDDPGTEPIKRNVSEVFYGYSNPGFEGISLGVATAHAGVPPLWGYLDGSGTAPEKKVFKIGDLSKAIMGMIKNPFFSG